MNRMLSLAVAALSAFAAVAQFDLGYRVELSGTASSDGNFAPYLISSNRYGDITQANGGYLRLEAWHATDTTRRLSYGFGLEAVGGYSNAIGYGRYDASADALQSIEHRPTALLLQQAFAEIKYRGVLLTAGLKHHEPITVDRTLSSGDLTFSGNSRPIPEVRAGFVNFQNIPLTGGWVQIYGSYGIGKTTDSDWLTDHYNYRESFVTTGVYFSYKNIYFCTKPSQPFSVTAGIQSAMQFGGTVRHYKQGVLTKEYTDKITFKKLLKTLVPCGDGSVGGDGFYEGNNLGTIDFAARYRFGDGTTLRAYFEMPFEDGSGMGKLNGFDGLYGLEYRAPHQGIVDAAVIEYIDTRNQSGPIHWAPDDFSGLSGHIPGHATGADNYYNNFQYCGYAHHGMAMGSPMLKSPLYNTDGYMSFTDTRVQGFHIGVRGHFCDRIEYRALMSYRRALGNYNSPRTEVAHDTSAMLEGVYRAASVEGLQLKCQLAIDRGTLYSNNFGALISVSYTGNLSF